MAVNVVRYAGNAFKSLGYAAVDVMGELNPVVKSFTETNAETGKQLYAMIKDWKGHLKKTKSDIMESDIAEFAFAYKKNLFEDLKNGTFYNKTRIDEYAERISGVSDDQLKSEFDDMFDDGEGDGLEGWDDDELESDMFMAETIDDVGEKIATSNAEVTIRSAEMITHGQKESTKILFEQNNRLFGEVLKGMSVANSTIAQFNGAMVDVMQTHANNSKTFFESADQKLDTIIGLLDNINKNTGIAGKNEEENEEELTFSDIVNSKGMPNLKKYMALIKQNVKNNVGEMGMLGDMFGTGENVLMSFAASPLQSAMQGIVKNLIPTMMKDSMAQFNNTLQGFFGSMISKINSVDDYDNPLMGRVKKIFGIDSVTKSDIDPSKFERGKVPWDGIARKSLVEVIPGYLSRITSVLTGEAPQVFDPKTGTMRSVRSVRGDAKRRREHAADYAGSDLRKEIENVMEQGQLFFDSKSQKDEWERDLKTFFESVFDNGGLRKQDLSDMGINELGVSNSKLLSDILAQIASTGEGRAKILNLNRKVLSERDSMTRSTKMAEKDGSVESFIRSGMFDEFFNKDDEDKDLRKNTGFTGVKTAGMSNIWEYVDKFGRTPMYYMQESFKRLDAIYKINAFMGDNWGFGGGGLGIYGAGGTTSRSSFHVDLSGIDPDESAVSRLLSTRENEHEKRAEEYHKSEVERFKSDHDNAITNYGKDNREKFAENIKSAHDKKLEEDAEYNRNWIDKMLATDSLEGKAEVFSDGLKKFVSKPFDLMAKAIGGLDEKMYNAIFGTDYDKDFEEIGFLGTMKKMMKDSFSKTNAFIDEEILKPLRAKMGIEKGDIWRKILGDARYEDLKERSKQGLWGVKDEETGRRSGGIFGDYIQSTKDNAKEAWGSFKQGATDLKNEIKDTFGGAFGHWSATEVDDRYARGGEVKRTGLAAVSKGEIIIPSEFNPNYHGTESKAQQMKNEENAVQRFFGRFATGTSGVGEGDKDAEIDLAVEDPGVIKAAEAHGIKLDTVKEYLRSIQGKIKQVDLEKRVKILTGKARAFVKWRKPGTKKTITKYDAASNRYWYDDGTEGTLEAGQWIKTDRNGKYHKMQGKVGGESFGGQMLGNLTDDGGAIDMFKNAMNRSFDGRSGSSKTSSQTVKEIVNDITGNLSSYGGASTVGAGIGLLAGGLIGAPFIGAAVGGAAALAKKSDAIQNFLFGKEVTGEDGQTKKEGGILSKETEKFIKERLPEMSKWGLLGTAAGLVLPGGPIVGTMLGAGIGFAKESSTLSNILFNETDDDGNLTSRGALRMTKKEFEEKVHKKLPKMGLGALAGAVAGPFGLVGNLLVGATLGYASDSERMRSAFFGHIGSDGERHGGLVEHVGDQIKKIFGFGKEETKGLAQFFKEDVMDPITGSITPILRQFGLMGEGLQDFGKKFGKLKKALFGESRREFGSFLDKGPFKALAHFGGGLSHLAIGAAKLPFSLPAQFIGGIGDRLKRRQLDKGTMDYMTAQERLDLDQELTGMNRFKKRMGKTGGIFKDAWGQLKGGHVINAALEGVGGLGYGVHSIASGGLRDLAFGATSASRNRNESFRAMDQWMADASEEEIDDIYQLFLNLQKSDKAKDASREKAVETLRGDVASLRFLGEKQKDKLFKAASSGDMEKLTKLVGKMNLTDIQKERINELLAGTTGKIANINSNSADADEQQAAALQKLKNHPVFKSVFKGNGTFDERRVEHLISQLETERIANQGDRSKAEKAGESIKDQMDMQKDQHAETVDLLKVLVNAVTLSGYDGTGSFDLPYPGAGADSGLEIKLGARMQRYGGTIADRINQVAEESAANEQQNTQGGEAQQQSSGINQSGFHNVGSNMQIKPRTSEDDAAEIDMAMEDNRVVLEMQRMQVGAEKVKAFLKTIQNKIKQVDLERRIKALVGKAVAFIKRIGTPAPSYADYAGSFANGGIVRKDGVAAVSEGEIIADGSDPQRYINTADGNYRWDVESHEYKAADKETADKEKAKARSQQAVPEISEKMDKLIDSVRQSGGLPTINGTGEEEKDQEGFSLLDMIMDKLGLDGGVAGALLAVAKKYGIVGIIGQLAGALGIGALFAGKFDGILNTLYTTITSAITGIDKESISQSGENGEEGLGEMIAKGSFENAVKTAGKHGLPKFLAKNKIANKIVSSAGKFAYGAAAEGMKSLGLITKDLPEGLVDLEGFLFDEATGDFVRDEATGDFVKTADVVEQGKLNKLFAKGKGKFSKIVGKGKELGGKVLGKMGKTGTKIKELGELAITKGKNLVGTAKGKAGELIATGKNKIAGIATKVGSSKAVTKVKGFGDSVKDFASRAWKAGKKAAGEEVDDVAEKALKENGENVAKNISKNVGEGIAKVWNKVAGKLPEKIAKNGDTIVAKLTKSIGKEVEEQSVKQGAKAGAKSIPFVGQAITVAFAIIDYIDGYTNAESYASVETMTEGQKVVVGLAKAFFGAIPIIGPFIPIKLLISLVTDVIMPYFGKTDMKEKRDEYEEKVKKYNDTHNTNYSVEQYNKLNTNRKGFWGNLKQDAKALFSQKARDERDMGGTDEDGNQIDTYINKRSARWKKFWEKKIQNGMDEEYAQALFRNEALADSSIAKGEYKANLQKYLDEYKKSEGAQPIPKITNDLTGLINKNYVGSFWNKQKGGDVEYGGGKKAQDYVGNYAEGGVVPRDGMAAVSKGEIITDGDGFLGSLFGNSKSKINYKDYEDITDITSLEGIAGDTSKTDWKKYWQNVDKDAGTGPLGGLKKLIRRIAASLAMPGFALSKVVDGVREMYDTALDTEGKEKDNQSGDSSSSSSSSSSSTTSSSTSNKSKGGFFSNAIKKVGGWIGGLFGGGSSIGRFGGASSPDGTFISQMDAKGMYGDSSYDEEGCAPATAAMLINQVNKKGMTLEEAGKYAVDKGYKVKGDGTKPGFFSDIFRNQGIDSENVNSREEIENSLRQGKPTILLGQDDMSKSKMDSPFGKNPHYVLATGMDRKGNVLINDPESSHGDLPYKSKILSKVKSGITTKQQGGGSGTFRRQFRKFYGGGSEEQRKKTIWDFIVHDQGMSEYAAAGIMGCWQIESSNNPKRVECDYLSSCKSAAATATDSLDNLHNYTVNHVFPSYTKIKIHKDGYAGGDGRYYCGLGLAQWTGPRAKRMIDFSNSHNLAWNDLSGQLSYFMQELNGGYSHVKSALSKAGSVEEATKIFLTKFEGSSLGLSDRTNAAKKIYNAFHGTQKDTDVATFVTDSGDSSGGDATANAAGEVAADATTGTSGLFSDLFSGLLKKAYGSSMIDGLAKFGLDVGGSGGADAAAATGDATGGDTATSGSATSGGITSSDGSIGQNVAVEAAKYIGNKYVWGGNDLNNGIDCSGFVQQLYKNNGFDALAKQRGSTRTMWADSYGKKVGNKMGDLKPGDVMFFSRNGQASGIHHVGIYVGNGHMIHAKGKDYGVVDDELSKTKYPNEFIGAERYGGGSGNADLDKLIELGYINADDAELATDADIAAMVSQYNLNNPLANVDTTGLFSSINKSNISRHGEVQKHSARTHDRSGITNRMDNLANKVGFGSDPKRGNAVGRSSITGRMADLANKAGFGSKPKRSNIIDRSSGLFKDIGNLFGSKSLGENDKNPIMHGTNRTTDVNIDSSIFREGSLPTHSRGKTDTANMPKPEATLPTHKRGIRSDVDASKLTNKTLPKRTVGDVGAKAVEGVNKLLAKSDIAKHDRSSAQEMSTATHTGITNNNRREISASMRDVMKSDKMTVQGMDTLLRTLSSISSLLERLVSNTDAIALISNILSEMLGMKKDEKKESNSSKQNNPVKRRKKDSGDEDFGENAELSNMLHILSSIAQA